VNRGFQKGETFMRKMLTAPIASLVIAAGLSTSPLFAGALVLTIENPQTNPEAAAKNAVVVARVTECKSPEKTLVTATAEGIVNGKRQTVPLQLIHLSTPGVYAVSPGFANDGAWAVKLVVTNPDYGKYVTSALVPAGGAPFRKESVRQFYNIPTEQDITAVLTHNSL
jgi:hypothetical protein